MGTTVPYFHIFPNSDSQAPLATAFISPAFRRLNIGIQAHVGQNKGGFRHLVLNFNNLDFDGNQMMRVADVLHGAGNHTLAVISPFVPEGDPINNSVKISVTTNANESEPFQMLYAGQGNNVSEEITFSDTDKDTISNPQPDQGLGNDGLWLGPDAPFHQYAGFGPPHGEPGIVEWTQTQEKTIFKGFGFRRDYYFGFDPGVVAFRMRDWWDGPDIFASFVIPSSGHAALTLILPFEAFAPSTRPELRCNFAIKPIATTIDAVPIGTPVVVAPGDIISVIGTDLMIGGGQLPLIDFGLTRDVVGPHQLLVEAEAGATPTAASFRVPSFAGPGLKSICFARREAGADGGTYTKDYVGAIDVVVINQKKFNKKFNRKLNMGLN